MCAPDAPEPTDPKETSAAQTGSSVSTAVANSFLNNVNEIGPDGTKVYEQTGTQKIKDPFTGKTYSVPTSTVTTTLSEQQQLIKDQSDAASLNMATLGNDLSGKLSEELTGNFELGNEAVEGRLMELGSARLDPMFAQREEDLRTQLANRGIRAGSDAYDREMGLLDQQENDAYNQLLLQGRGQASQEMLTEDNRLINRISALMSGGQVSQPDFMTGVNSSNIATTDNASIIGNYDNATMNAWQQEQAALGSTLGGIGGLFNILL